jgi:hypothetical protein
MKKSEQVFSSFIRNSDFLNDLECVLSFDKDKIELFSDIMIRSKYRSYYFYNMSKFIADTKTSQEKSLSILRILDYFAYTIIPKHNKEDILQALDELFESRVDLSNLEFIINKFNENSIREKLKILDLIDDEIGTINPHFKNITFNIQNRFVMKDNEIIYRLPIATVEFNITKENDSKYIMELLGEDIDQLINGLKDIQKKLIKISIEEKGG